MKADEWSDITDEMPDMSDGGPNDDSTPEPNLPEVVANGRPLPDITAEGVAALVAANTPPVLFVRQGSLARVRADERGLPGPFRWKRDPPGEHMPSRRNERERLVRPAPNPGHFGPGPPR